MIKKVLIGTGVAFLLAVFFFGRNAISYVKTSVAGVRDSVDSSVPVTFKIENARRMLRDSEGEVRNAMHMIARQEVEVEKARKQVTDLEARLTKEKEELRKLNEDAKSGKQVLEYAGRKFTLDQVKNDLARRYGRVKTSEETLATQQKLLGAREKALIAAQDKFNGMQARRRQLAVELENLDARQQLVAAAQAANAYNFDDSQLGRLNELVSDMKTRIDVSEKLVNAESYDSGEIPVSQPTSADIVDQISQYLDGKAPVVKTEAEQPESKTLARNGK